MKKAHQLGRRRRARTVLDDARQLLLAEAPEHHSATLAPESADQLLHIGPLACGCLLVGDQDERRPVVHAAGDELEQRDRGAVGRVEVVDHDQERMARAHVSEDGGDRFTETGSAT